MASLSDLSLRDRIWYHRYSFRRVEPLVTTRLRRPLADARIALVTSAGLHRPDDEPFGEEKGGDWSSRIIPRVTALDTLLVDDHVDAVILTSVSPAKLSGHRQREPAGRSACSLER
jgi:hypothetical protein